jgi:hypothetical protein
MRNFNFFGNLSILLLIFIFSGFTNQLNAQRIIVDGTRFVVDKNEIIMNGVNTPWDKWNDFGGKYDHDFWDKEFAKIREAGGNCTRIWISCDGELGINIDSTGYVSGATEAHWKDLEDMFDLAQTHQIYIMATMLSFDHTKSSHANFNCWRRMYENKENVKSYITNYLIPFVEKFKRNPYLWSIDACNEIEWVNQDKDNAQASWENLQYYVASAAIAVHQKSKILFTLGSAGIKWNCDLPKPFEGNYWSDVNLQKQNTSPLARLDFYSPHYYGWVVRSFGNFCTDKSPSDYQINDRPCMVAENPARGIYIQIPQRPDSLVIPIKDAYIKSYENGWKGLMVWTSNGVDQFGSLTDCGPGLKAFFEKYPDLIYPKLVKD